MSKPPKRHRVALPKIVDVAGYKYKIVTQKGPVVWNNQEHAGLHEGWKHLITLDHSADIDHQSRVEVLIHELLHAIWDKYQLSTEHEEQYVMRLGIAIASLLRNNPKLVEYITRDE